MRVTHMERDTAVAPRPHRAARGLGVGIVASTPAALYITYGAAARTRPLCNPIARAPEMRGAKGDYQKKIKYINIIINEYIILEA